MPWDGIDKKYIKKIIEQITGDVDEDSGELISPCFIKGQGMITCYSPVKRCFVSVNRGVQVYLLSLEMDDKDRVLVFCNPHIIAIHPDDLEDIGFD